MARMSCSAALVTRRDRKALFAATPPTATIVDKLCSIAHLIVLVARAAATVSWKLAAISAIGNSSPLGLSFWVKRNTAVFKPLKLES